MITLEGVSQKGKKQSAVIQAFARNKPYIIYAVSVVANLSEKVSDREICYVGDPLTPSFCHGGLDPGPP